MPPLYNGVRDSTNVEAKTEPVDVAMAIVPS